MTCVLVTCSKLPLQPHHQDTHITENYSGVGAMDCVGPRAALTLALCWQCRPTIASVPSMTEQADFRNGADS